MRRALFHVVAPALLVCSVILLPAFAQPVDPFAPPESVPAETGRPPAPDPLPTDPFAPPVRPKDNGLRPLVPRDPDPRDAEGRQADAAKELLAGIEKKLAALRATIEKEKSLDTAINSRKSMRAKQIDTLDQLTRVYWAEYKNGKRNIRDLLDAVDRLAAARLETTELVSERVEICGKHLRRLEMIESELKKRFASNPDARGDFLASKAARQDAQLKAELEKLTPAPRAEQIVLEERVKSATALYQKVDAIVRFGRGGSAAEHAKAGVAMHRAKSELGLAQARPEVALTEMKMACAYADRAVRAFESMFSAGVGRMTIDVLVRAQTERQQAFDDFLRLERRLGTPGEAPTDEPKAPRVREIPLPERA